jgi:hypothetical protein
VTYGYLIAKTIIGDPADKAGLQGGTQQVLVAGEYVTIDGDIIIAINTTPMETRIRGIDNFSTFLEEYTSPNQAVYVTIVRNSQTMTIPVTLGTRPPQHRPWFLLCQNDIQRMPKLRVRDLSSRLAVASEKTRKLRVFPKRVTAFGASEKLSRRLVTSASLHLPNKSQIVSTFGALNPYSG